MTMSKTLSSSAELGSRKQELATVVLFLVLAAAVLLFAKILFNNYFNDDVLVIENQRIMVEVADEPSERSAGLANREKLATNSGMLFVFKTNDYYCFWMKDTKIPLDIIWLDENKTVVDIRTNVQPDSYPEAFCPGQKARYVLELNAGSVNDLGIVFGSTASF